MKMNLLKKMILFILLPAVFGFIALTFYASYAGHEAVEFQVNSQLKDLVALKGEQISDTLQSLENVIPIALNTSAIRTYLSKMSENRRNKISFNASDVPTIISSHLENISKKYSNFSNVFLTDNQGFVIAASDRSSLGRDYSKYDFFRDAVQGKVNKQTFILPEADKIGISFAIPIMQNSVIIGTAAGFVNLVDFSADFLSDINFFGISNAYAYDPKGICMMDMDSTLVGLDDSKYFFVQELLQNKTGFLVYDWKGVNKYAYHVHIPYMDWVFAFSLDYDLLMKSATNMGYNVSIISTLISLVIASIIFFVARALAISLRGGAEVAKYVAAGNFELTAEQNTKLDRAKNSGGEMADLANGMSIMIDSLVKMLKNSEEKNKEAEIATRNAREATEAAEEAASKASLARKEGLQDAATRLEGIVRTIASASEQLSTQIELSTSGAEEQSARMTATATTMDEMYSTVLKVAKNSSTSAELADTTKEKALDGAKITQKCQESMTQVKNESLKLRQNMGELASHAQSISAVMSVISDIADQTNLLALNAAIEAARAGEAGRGFAVVADEVRKLAEKTITSTTDVANAINAIQQSTEVNVKQVDTAVERIEEATELAMSGGHALQVILEIAEQSADGIRAIATASEEQSTTSDEVAQSIATVSGIANNTVSAMNKATQAINSLAEQAQQLSILVENLKNG